MTDYDDIATEHCRWARNNGFTAREVCRSVYRSGNCWLAALNAIKRCARDMDYQIERTGRFPSLTTHQVTHTFHDQRAAL